MLRAALKPMLHAVRGRVIHIQEHAKGSKLGIGYAAPIEVEEDIRVAVIPIGFWDGLNHVPPLGRVLIGGHSAPVMGRRSFQHTVIECHENPRSSNWICGDVSRCR